MVCKQRRSGADFGAMAEPPVEEALTVAPTEAAEQAVEAERQIDA